MRAATGRRVNFARVLLSAFFVACASSPSAIEPPGTGGGGSSSTGAGGGKSSAGAGGSPSAMGGAGGASPAGMGSGAGGTAGTTGVAGSSSGSSATGGAAGAASDKDASSADVGAAGGRAGGMPVSDAAPIRDVALSSDAPVLVPPAPDTASKIPILRPPSNQYTVVGNYPYGPLTAQRLDVLYPNNAGPRGTVRLPVVLMFHGGGWIHSYNNDSGKDHMTTFSDRFLAHGFMVCDAEYRVADGTPDGALAPAAVEDALLAAKWCWDYMDYFHGDRSRYVVTGASAGGHLALMVGMATADSNLGPTNPNDYKIAAIVDGYGIADVQAVLDGLAAPWIPATLPNRAAIVTQVNPMTYVRKNIPPMIVVQGSNDNTAPVGDSRRLVAMLAAAGADATMHEVAGAGHGFTAGAEWDDAEKAMFDWLTAQGIIP